MTEPAAALPYMPTKAAQEDQNTPEEVLEPVRRIFGGHIDFDPCGNPGSIVQAKRQVWLPKWVYEQHIPALHAMPPEVLQSPELAARYADRLANPPLVQTREIPPDVIIGDGLEVPWSGSTFVNPPFSAKLLSAFLARARDAAERGVPSIVLTKAKTGLKGWHASVPAAPAVCFIDHRLTFGGAGGESAPFDCALILFTKSRELVHRFALELDGKMGDVMFHR